MSIKITVEQALAELEKYVNYIVGIDDLVEYIKSDRADFIQNWSNVNQFYKYIIYHTDGLDDVVIKAIDLISDLAARQPLLGKMVNMMLEPKKNEEEQIQNREIADSDLEYISALTSEVQNMPQWDYEHVKDIRLQLEEYQQMLMDNKSLLELDVYRNLMDKIGFALSKIDRVNAILEINVKKL